MEKNYRRETGSLEDVEAAIQAFEEQTGYELGFERDEDRLVYNEERQNGLEAEITDNEAWYSVNGCITDSLNTRDLPELAFMENALRLTGYRPENEQVDTYAPHL